MKMFKQVLASCMHGASEYNKWLTYRIRMKVFQQVLASCTHGSSKYNNHRGSNADSHDG